MVKDMKLGLDLDGVLANFNEGFRRRLISANGRDMNIQPNPTGPYWDWPQYYGYTNDEVKATWDSIRTDPDFWQYLEAMPGASAFLNWLWRIVADTNWNNGRFTEEHNVEVYFLTSRNHGPMVKRQTELWLLRNGWEGPATVLITRGSKGPIAKSLGLTHVLDDRPENLLSVMEHTMGDCWPLLFHQEHNAEFDAEGGAVFTRVMTLDGFKATLTEALK